MRTLALLGVVLACPALLAQRPADMEVMNLTARQTVDWIEKQARPVKGDSGGVTFPTTAEVPAIRTSIVYGGGAGILIFLENAAARLRLKKASELADKTYLGLLASAREAEGGNTWADRGQREGAAGLYTGDAGVGHAFLVRALLRDDQDAMKHAVAVGDAILARSLTSEVGNRTVRWWDEQVEIIYGAAGTALFLLELADASKHERFRAAAQEVGHWLVGESMPMKSKPLQRAWRWQLAGNRQFVGFSHGTAGVAYALLRIGIACKDDALVAAATDGANLLRRVAIRDQKLIRFPVVDGNDTSMGGWCHGPPGTARLFLLLHHHTKDDQWLEMALGSSRWVMAQAGDEDDEVPPSFPASFCCGVAGAVDYFCDLYRVTGDKTHRAFALRAGRFLADQAVKDDDGARWPNGTNAHGRGGDAHGVDLMGGASGAAFALLRVMSVDVEKSTIRGLPDRAVR